MHQITAYTTPLRNPPIKKTFPMHGHQQQLHLGYHTSPQHHNIFTPTNTNSHMNHPHTLCSYTTCSDWGYWVEWSIHSEVWGMCGRILKSLKYNESKKQISSAAYIIKSYSLSPMVLVHTSRCTSPFLDYVNTSMYCIRSLQYVCMLHLYIHIYMCLYECLS